MTPPPLSPDYFAIEGSRWWRDRDPLEEGMKRVQKEVVG